jgi:hypothetical protein
MLVFKVIQFNCVAAIFTPYKNIFQCQLNYFEYFLMLHSAKVRLRPGGRNGRVYL